MNNNDTCYVGFFIKEGYNLKKLSIVNLQCLSLKCTAKWLSYTCVCAHANSLQSRLSLCDAMNYGHHSLLSMGYSRQEYWSGLPCPPPGDLPDPGIACVSCIGRQVLYHWHHLESPFVCIYICICTFSDSFPLL